MDPSLVNVPPLKNLTIDNITDNVKLINSNCENPRLKYILERLVQHLHDFARETRLSHEEWMTGLLFLTAVGQKCTDVRQEFILLSDILGLSLLVDSIDHPKPPASTEGTVLGPFHSHEAEIEPNGAQIAHDPDGEPCLVLCTIKDTDGKPISDVKIDIWETDSKGFYDVQYPGREGPDQRAVMHSDEKGIFWFKAITPVPYPIPADGPVGKLLIELRRHCYRPSHMHFMFEKVGFDHLITALYLRGDPYETSDAVFGVKDSLIVDLKTVSSDQAREYGVSEKSRLITYDFVLVSEEESRKLQEKNAMDAMKALGRKMKLYNGLPIPDVD
ncbi:catechol dioxygenase like protein [Acrodontium crateriforme]|uniref:Catechol dioxygenase like protein n=1 Tax=Acrodontium crateriforme TaxID=150365 RepID=A0AAQ3M1W7_9PEZI|nr:catechol dioxygenase like protein [Acrodontium crateriforme]